MPQNCPERQASSSRRAASTFLLCERCQHSHHHNEKVANRPEFPGCDPLLAIIAGKVANRFFCLGTRDSQDARPVAPWISAKGFHDIRADRMSRILHLPDVQQPPS